jgi:transcription elongation factor Elf1
MSAWPVRQRPLVVAVPYECPFCGTTRLVRSFVRDGGGGQVPDRWCDRCQAGWSADTAVEARRRRHNHNMYRRWALNTELIDHGATHRPSPA